MTTRTITRWASRTAFTAVVLAAMLMLGAGAGEAARTGGGGGRAGGGGGYSHGGGLSYRGGGGSYRGGGGGYDRGGSRYRGGYGPYRGYYPRSVFRVGIGFGYWYPPPYYYDDYYYGGPVVVDPPVVHEHLRASQEPPRGCYYWDPFCERRFSRLDVYEEHLRDHDHDRILEAIESDTGTRVGVFEYTQGHWVTRD